MNRSPKGRMNPCALAKSTEADAIAEDLGHLPLALHLAGSYLNTYPHHTVAQYRKDLTIAHRSLKGRGALPSPTRHEQDVEATFMLSFNQLEPTKALDALALSMLDGTAWCAPGVPIPRNLVLAFVPDKTDSDDAVDALRRLQQLGMLDGVDAVVLHRLLSQVVQTRLGSMDMLAVVEDTITTMASQINDSGIPTRMLPLAPHLRYATMRALDRGDERTVRCAYTLGMFAYLRGAYGEAQPLFERALWLCEQRAEVSLVTVGLLNQMGLVLTHQGHYGEAQQCYERAVAIGAALMGDDHVHVHGIRLNLAQALHAQGQVHAAQALVADAAMSDRMDAATRAGSLNQRALLLEQQGQYPQAQALYEHAVALATSVFGAAHPTTAKYRSNVAVVLGRQGQYVDAERIYAELGVLLETRVGRDHPDVALNLNNHAIAQVAQGKYGEARVMMERAVAICDQVWDIPHPTMALSLTNLSMTLLYQERYSEAQPLLEQAIAIYERVYGPMHPDIAVPISHLAGVLEIQGRYREAQSWIDQAVAVRETTLGADHPVTQQTRAQRTRLMMKLWAAL